MCALFVKTVSPQTEGASLHIICGLQPDLLSD